MPVEICGSIASPVELGYKAGNSSIPPTEDRAFIRRFARQHEDGGFDSVLIGYGSTRTDGFSVAAHGSFVTDRLRFLLAHRPGFVAPTLAARKLATLDHLSEGRIAVNIVSGGSDAEMAKDGDWVDHDGRYRRTDEYLDIVRKTWTSPTPFDYDGEFYLVERAYSEVKPLQQPYVPLYVSGASKGGVHAGAKHADVYMMWGEPLAEVRERIAEVHQAAAAYGRKPGISVSFRPILAATEEKAWERAYAILERVSKVRRGGALDGTVTAPQNVGSQRLLAAAAKGDVLDTRLFTAIARANGAAGNSTALVGTPEQVAEALLAYYDLGVTTLLIRGFDPEQDAIDYGRDLIPLIRAEVAKRDAARAVPTLATAAS